MAKIKCPICGTRYSGTACPACTTPAPVQPKKKKKILLPVIIVLVILLAVSCVSGGNDEDVKNPSNVQGDNSATQGSQGTQNTPETQGTTQSPEVEVTITEMEIYNEGGITVTVKKLESSLFGPTISVTASNDTDKNIRITARDLSVNSYMMSSSGLYCEVAAGKKANDEINLMSSELKEAGIDTIAQVQFYLHISDTDSYETIDDSELITIDTSVSGTYVQNIDDSGDVIYDSHGVRVICKGLKQDVIWDGTVVFYIENNSDQSVSVHSQNVSVNGFMESVSMWEDLRPGTRAISGMYLLNLEDLELESIDEVENIEFELRIINADTWAEIDTTDVITLEFN